MSITIKPINYKEYPECMFAMIAAFMEGDDGDDLRRVAGSVFFRSTDSNGFTYRNGLLHSYDDQPSISMNDQKTWHKDGNLHREGDLPAVIEGDRQIWYKDGNLHRDGDLPAIIEGEYKVWYQNGLIHRDNDLPAVIDPRQNLQVWYKNGLRHREGGKPAGKLRRPLQ